MKFLVILILTCLFSLPAFAQDAGGRYLPERKSSFSTGGKKHNPFWPIAYTPQQESKTQKPTQAEVVDIPRGTLNISSILMGRPPLAVINEGEYTIGDEIPIVLNGQKINVQLIQVGDGFVKVRFGKKVFVVRKY